MANQEHVDRLMQGVRSWNKWRQKDRDVQPDLRNAILIEARFSDADLNQTNLSNADLHGTWFNGANFSDANLCGANLSDANLAQAFFYGADLSTANLSRAYLHGANLETANLDGTNLSGMHLWGTIFSRNDLSTVKGLVEIDHEALSYVELHSIKLPQDGSALHFFRGTGVPDEWIDIYRTTIMKPIQYYSCFISYSSRDEILARRLHADLQDQGVTTVDQKRMEMYGFWAK